MKADHQPAPDTTEVPAGMVLVYPPVEVSGFTYTVQITGVAYDMHGNRIDHWVDRGSFDSLAEARHQQVQLAGHHERTRIVAKVAETEMFGCHYTPWPHTCLLYTSPSPRD